MFPFSIFSIYSLALLCGRDRELHNICVQFTSSSLAFKHDGRRCCLFTLCITPLEILQSVAIVSAQCSSVRRTGTPPPVPPPLESTYEKPTGAQPGPNFFRADTEEVEEKMTASEGKCAV